MKIIINVLINNFVLEDVNSFYEFFFLRKILIEKYNFKSILDEYNDYTKEILLDYFQRKEFYIELIFVCGIIYYYGVENILEKDYIKSMEKLKLSYYSTNSESRKRFCYSYIYKVRKKL